MFNVYYLPFRSRSFVLSAAHVASIQFVFGRLFLQILVCYKENNSMGGMIPTYPLDGSAKLTVQCVDTLM